MKTRKIIKSIYGNVALLKGYCKSCRGYSFIIDGEFQCCNALVDKIYNKELNKRESEGRNRKRKLKLSVKNDILDKQNGKCIYCGHSFDKNFFDIRKSKFIRLRINFDHFIPWSYSQDSNPNNLYAACHICNEIKGDKYFYDLISAKEYVNERRKQKGY